MSIKITNSGAFTTIQDLGRLNHMKFGFSQSGVMDVQAMKKANFLVGNNLDEAVLEMTLTGITAIFNCDAVVAVTGGDFTPLINNKPRKMNTSLFINKGEILRLPKAVNGCRCYLAVKGGYKVEKVLGSKSVNLKCSIGKKVENKDVIELNNTIVTDYIEKSLPYVKYENNVTVRVVLGPQNDYFTNRGVATFLNSIYTVTPESDRMGIKLKGTSVESKKGYDIISDAIPLGSIQVPSNGQPIILMADRQTTGGYPKIATVISTDIPKLAQLLPGGTVKFAEIDIHMAQKILKESDFNNGLQ